MFLQAYPHMYVCVLMCIYFFCCSQTRTNSYMHAQIRHVCMSLHACTTHTYHVCISLHACSCADKHTKCWFRHNHGYANIHSYNRLNFCTYSTFVYSHIPHLCTYISHICVLTCPTFDMGMWKNRFECMIKTLLSHVRVKCCARQMLCTTCADARITQAHIHTGPYIHVFLLTRTPMIINIAAVYRTCWQARSTRQFWSCGGKR